MKIYDIFFHLFYFCFTTIAVYFMVFLGYKIRQHIVIHYNHVKTFSTGYMRITKSSTFYFLL